MTKSIEISIKLGKPLLVAYNALAQIHLATNNLDLADRWFTRSALLNQVSSETYFGLAVISYRRSAWKDALRFCKRARDLHPKDVTILLLVGMIKSKELYHDEAKEMFQDALDLEPDNALVCDVFGDFYLELFMYKDAVEFFRKGVKLGSIHSLDGLLTILIDQRQFDNFHETVSSWVSSLDQTMLLYPSILAKTMLMEGNLNSKSVDVFEKTAFPRNHTFLSVKSGIINNVSQDLIEMNPSMAMTQLENILGIDSALFMGNMQNCSDRLSKLHLRNLWLCLKLQGATATGLALMNRFQKENPDSNTFWYNMALAEAGAPWNLFVFCDYLYRTIPKDHFAFYLKAFGMIRQILPINDYESIINDCLLEIEPRYLNLKAIFELERTHLYLRLKKLDAVDELLSSRDFKTCSYEWKILWIRTLMKKNNSISAKQALMKITAMLTDMPRDDQLLYFCVAILCKTGDFTTFDENFAKWTPKYFEFVIKKEILGIKYGFTKYNDHLIEKHINNLERQISALSRWKEENKLPVDVILVENLKLKLIYFKCKHDIQKERWNQASEKFALLNDYPVNKRVDVTIRMTYKLYGLPQAMKVVESIIVPENQNEEFYTLAWREVAMIFVENNMNNQMNQILPYFGAFRFPRFDSIFPLMQISLYRMDLENLQVLDAKMDTFLSENIEKSTTDLNVRSYMRAFRIGIILYQLSQLINSKSQKRFKLDQYVDNILYNLSAIHIGASFSTQNLMQRFFVLLDDPIVAKFGDSSKPLETIIWNAYERWNRVEPNNVIALEFLAKNPYSKTYYLKWIDNIRDDTAKTQVVKEFAGKLLINNELDYLDDLVKLHHELDWDLVTMGDDAQNQYVVFCNTLKNNRSIELNDMRALVGIHQKKNDWQLAYFERQWTLLGRNDEKRDDTFLSDALGLLDADYDAYNEKFTKLWDLSVHIYQKHWMELIHLIFLSRNKEIRETRDCPLPLRKTTFETVLNIDIVKSNVKLIDIEKRERNKMNSNEFWNTLSFLFDSKTLGIESTSVTLMKIISTIQGIDVDQDWTNFHFVLRDITIRDAGFKVRMFKVLGKLPTFEEALFKYFVTLKKSTLKDEKTLLYVLQNLQYRDATSWKAFEKRVDHPIEYHVREIIHLDSYADFRYYFLIFQTQSHLFDDYGKSIAHSAALMCLESLVQALAVHIEGIYQEYVLVNATFVRPKVNLTSDDVIHFFDQFLSWYEWDLKFPLIGVAKSNPITSILLSILPMISYQMSLDTFRLVNIFVNHKFLSRSMVMNQRHFQSSLVGLCVLIPSTQLPLIAWQEMSEWKQFFIDLACLASSERYSECLRLFNSQHSYIWTFFSEQLTPFSFLTFFGRLFGVEKRYILHERGESLDFEVVDGEVSKHYFQCSNERYQMEYTMKTLINLVTVKSDVEFLRIGRTIFVYIPDGSNLNEINATSKKKGTEMNYTPWFESNGQDGVLLRWNTITKVKLKKSGQEIPETNSFQLFEQSWYSKVSSITIDIAGISAIQWIFGIIQNPSELVVKSDHIFIRRPSMLFESDSTRLGEECYGILNVIPEGRVLFETKFKETLTLMMNLQNRMIIMSTLLLSFINDESILRKESRVRSQHNDNILMSVEDGFLILPGDTLYSMQPDRLLLGMMKRKAKMAKLFESRKFNEEPLGDLKKEYEQFEIHRPLRGHSSLLNLLVDRLERRIDGNVLSIDQICVKYL